MSDSFKKFIEQLFKSVKDSGGRNTQSSRDTGASGEGSPPLTKFHWALIIASAGLGIMIVSSFFTMDEGVMPLSEPLENEQNTVETSVLPNKDPKTMADYEKQFEEDLEKMLGELIGVNDVAVMVNLESSEELVIAENVRDHSQTTDEKDQQGGTRQIKDVSRDTQVVIVNANNSDSPLVIKTIKPKVRGVWVLAKGADNPQVKTMITDALQRVLNVPYHNISVLPKK